MARDSINEQLHVVMFPFFAFGHISPFIQLSNKLSSHGVRITFFSIPGYVSRIKTLLFPKPNTQIIPLQIPTIQGLTDTTAGTSDLPPSEHGNLMQALDLMQPQIKSLLSDLKPNFVFFDFAQYWMPSLASELGIKTFFFSVFSAISGAYITVPARLTGAEGGDVTVSDLKKPPPGFPPSSTARLRTYEARDFMFIFRSSDGGPRGIDRDIVGFKGCTAIVKKTCYEMEGPYLDFMSSQLGKRILLTGPLVPEPPFGELDEKWGNWLSRFKQKSVVFCSFGSETFLNDDQIRELALGLELTGLPFLLVLNFPANSDAVAELARALPEGFTERVKERGVVHTGWVQQQLILTHESVGCYLCHSGFSSVIEALLNNCQLALLPLKGDQFLNAKLVAEDMKAGVEVNRRDEDGHFGKEDVYEAVKKVMVEVEEEPGKSIRVNHEKWRAFLLDKKIQDKFISDLVAEMKTLAKTGTPDPCTA
ncbi:hypothetical protein TIFTF001_019426 [Ficus carica]|uniref:Glycosyltransferase n=1 Tax=Ficus carica TaxID=3494 RepID=A0AA88AWX7_FICCA|nr:hypothetical protein TIFTF001_019426 [Ficus carica]